jgi:hypothetical protein
VADVLFVCLVALALYVAIDGGFILWPDTIRLSVKSPWRVIAWAIGVLALRHAVVRRPPLHRRITRLLAWAARLSGPLRDDAVEQGVEGVGTLTGIGPLRRRFRFYSIYTVGVLAVFTALTAVMTYPQVRYLDSGVTFDEGDPLFSTWRLAWVAHQLPRDPLHLFDGNIFYPERGVLALSDSMVVPALMAAPLHWIGVPPLLVYNIMLLAGFVLSGAAMFLLVRSLTRHTGAAFIAGFIFAFLPYRYMHYSHLELQMAFCMPLCLWALHRVIRHGRITDGLLVGLFLALQCLSSWYYGIFLATFLVPVTIALLVGERAADPKRSLSALVAGGALATLLIVPMAMPYFSARRSVGERPLDEIVFYSATPQNYFNAHHRNVLLGKATERWAMQERELFMGIAVPLIALIGLWPPLSASRIAYALGLVLAFDLSLGFNGALYPWFHQYVLPYRGLRVPARMAMVVGFGLAVLAGYGAARILRVLNHRGAARLGVVLLVALVFVEYRSTLALKEIPKRPPPIYDALPHGPKTVLLELPLRQPDIALEPTFMYFSTFFWHNLINGYSGFKPTSYHELLEKMTNFPDETSIAELRRRGTTHVVMHERFYRRGEYLQMVARLEQCADLEPLLVLQSRHRETRLYRLLDSDRAADSVVSKQR